MGETSGNKLDNDEHANLRTEYEVINNWRNSNVQHNALFSYIFITMAIVPFFGSFIVEGIPFLSIIAWIFSSIIIIFWRYYAHKIDESIVFNTYPRLVELEERLNLQFVREYLKEKIPWDPEIKPNKDSLPNRSELELQLQKIKTKNIRNPLEKYLKPPYGSRGHMPLNYFAFTLILFEFIVAVIWTISKMCTN